MKKILVTGAAGFIGYYLVKKLLERGDEVVGIDNINDYYDVQLKYSRLEDTGIVQKEITDRKPVQSTLYSKYRFIKLDLTEREEINRLFENEKFEVVCNLAAQAGVRYSIDHPFTYVDSNIVGFANILEACRQNKVKHFVYASSSSIYGLNEKIPYSEDDQVDKPVSLYAATKKANELMAHAYSHLYHLPTTGVRFFTVYGPWGRPDMAPFLFMKSIMNGTSIKVFNHGNLERDFTYIDDIIQGLEKIVDAPPADQIPYKIYNIGNSSPVKLMDFIYAIEKATGKDAVKEYVGMQPGDVYRTYADTSHLERDFGYKPQTTIQKGIDKFYKWYVEYSN
ncbi:NAD-dependent epimerase [uncultured Bacteroides sp.]|uniref:NAD-dependent epimerase n=1 Tax=uncultured Bacteroides sp. TaxID=162156 RepID=UPI002AABADF2|nr:NAD-dependent epimerase [uncultured Bacteroides sp.]